MNENKFMHKSLPSYKNYLDIITKIIRPQRVIYLHIATFHSYSGFPLTATNTQQKSLQDFQVNYFDIS